MKWTHMNAQKGSVIAGFAYAIASAVSFGLIPFSSLPVMNSGMDFVSVLIYRFAISCIFIFPILLINHIRLSISRSEIWRMALLALFYCCSALFLFWSYHYMSSGKATTIHFMYPVFTSLIMVFFFHEHISWKTFVAILLAVAGVALLADDHSASSSISMIGLLIVLASGLYYAIYLVAVNQMKVRNMGSLELTFYVMLFGLFFLILIALIFGHGIGEIKSTSSFFHLLSLALISTVFSNITLILAIKRLGSTRTAIMGAFEPLTAVCVGILFLHEEITTLSVLGIMGIIAAISLLVYAKK